MNLYRLIGRLLAVIAVAALVAAPLVTPAAAKALAVAEMTGMSAMAAMAGDMQCCPDGQKNNNCQDCPLVAMCMLTIAQAGPSPTDGVQISFQSRRLTFALVDLIGDGLIGTPPDHPPRIST